MRNLSFLVFLFIFATNPSHSQTTINIPADYPTIQAGIDAANNGDLVLVADGTYLENINYKGKAITVASHFLNDGNKSHIENTIIDGSDPSNPDSGSVVTFNSGEDTTSVLCGFTITDGTGTYISSSDFRIGGGIMLFYSGAKICHIIITSNTIDNSTIYTRCYGGGILAAYSPSLIITNNVISENVIENYSAVGGGISIYFTGPTWITSNKIISNVVNGISGSSGGGIDIWSPNSELFVMNNIIKGNQVLSNNYGGGGIDIWNASSPIFICNNLITENTGYLGGGILVDYPTQGDYQGMNNFKLNDNTMSETNVFDNNSFSANKLLVEAVIENNTVVDNSATSYCGGIYCRNTSPEIRNSIVWGNQAPAGPQIEGTGFVEYSDVEGGYTGTGNIDCNPEFLDTTYFLLSNSSCCIDTGNPETMYNDVENPNNFGFALYPAMGALRNDMGAFGGPNSTWASVLSDTLYVPTDYTTIQEAIDAAINGNVVLVADGTYLENINFKGKAITVASYFLVDGNETHIENTIIDGSQPSHPDSGSVVTFNNGEDTTSVLCGFTITGGTGTASGNYRVGGGILFYNSGAQIENNIIEFNTIENAPWAYGGGIFTNWDNNVNIVIKNNIIQNNTCIGTEYACGGGIKITTTGYALISNNKILENTVSAGIESTGGGIECWGPIDEVYIVNNYIKGNTVQTNYNGGGGIDIYECTTNTPILENNIIVGNSTNLYGGGVDVDLNLDDRLKPGGIKTPNKTESDCLLTPVLFANNTIINNTAGVSGGGIYTHDMTSNIMNTILWGNTAPVDSQIAGTVNVVYSDVEGGFIGEGNINADPSFSDTLFHLENWSLCIGVGIDSLDIGGTMYYCPPFCYYGSPRPNPAGSMPDMGACESPLADPINSMENDLSQIPNEYSLEQNYPNPFNPTTTIKYGITERTFVELRVYDILGREVELLVNKEQDAGYYNIKFNSASLASGIYLYQLKAGEFVQTKKMVLLR